MSSWQLWPKVADAALDALGRRPSVIPGRRNRLAALALGRLLSRRRAVSIMGTQTAKLSRSRG